MTKDKTRGRKKGSRNTASQTYARFYQVAKALGMIPKKEKGSSGTGITKPYVDKLRRYAIAQGIGIDEVERQLKAGELEKYRSDVRKKSILSSVDEVKKKAIAAKVVPIPTIEKEQLITSSLMSHDFKIDDLKTRGQVLRETAIAVVKGDMDTETAKIVVSIMKLANTMFPDSSDESIPSIVMNTVVNSREEAAEFTRQLATEEFEFVDLHRCAQFSWLPEENLKEVKEVKEVKNET